MTFAHKSMEDAPVDYSKSKFSIDFLLEKPVAKLSRPICLDSPNSDADREPSPPHSSNFSLGGDNERPKRPRTAFTSAQIKTLETEFDRNKYLSVAKRVELSRQLGLSQQQLKVWYQNRRTKWKRKYANDLESMAQQYYSSMGIPGSRPMLIGDRLWIFNAAQISANEVLMNDHSANQAYRRGTSLETPSTHLLPIPPVSRLPAAARTLLAQPSPFRPINFTPQKPGQ